MRTWQGANGGMDTVRHDLQALRNDVAKLAQEIPSMLSDVRDDSVQAARERVDRIKTNIDTSLSQLSERGREAADAVTEMTDDMTRSIEESFHAHPITTIVVALGIGYVLGSMRKR
ncbi:MAG TPA: hypothetical protein VKP67_17950 [Xanthobacteraceae bacterium]|nr:hypothetical protein [Xanthobacteraceae bacterium]